MNHGQECASSYDSAHIIRLRIVVLPCFTQWHWTTKIWWTIKPLHIDLMWDLFDSSPMFVSETLAVGWGVHHCHCISCLNIPPQTSTGAFLRTATVFGVPTHIIWASSPEEVCNMFHALIACRDALLPPNTLWPVNLPPHPLCLPLRRAWQGVII